MHGLRESVDDGEDHVISFLIWQAGDEVQCDVRQGTPRHRERLEFAWSRLVGRLGPGTHAVPPEGTLEEDQCSGGARVARDFREVSPLQGVGGSLLDVGERGHQPRCSSTLGR